MSTEQSKIFLDKRKLSTRYIPPILPHRDKQLQELDNFFRGSLVEPSKDFLTTLQIIGPAGSGKTSTVTHFGADFEKDARKLGVNLQHVYVNLKLQGGSRVLLYRYILNSVAPKLYSPGYGAEEMLRILLEQLAEEKKYLLISLDEIDYIKSAKDTGVVYDLTRLNEINPKKPCNVLGVIFIARSKEFHDKLDLAELSTLGRLVMEFPSYRSKEIVDILTERVREAFVPGAVPDDVLEYIADVTVPQPVGGDLRYALDLLLYAGNLAEAQGSGRLLREHVRRVHNEMHPSIVRRTS